MDIDVLRALSNQIARVAMELKPLNDNLRRLNITNAENARLREVVADGELHAREILAENAKLREFIDLKETCWKYVGWCSECPYNGVDDEHDDCNCTVREKVNSLASELGIEVGS